MRYAELKKGDIFSCKIRDTYTDIYLYYDGQYVNVCSVQKKDYPYILGLGERTDANSGLIPITLTEETIKFCLGKYYGVGAVNFQPNLTMSPNISDIITPGITEGSYRPDPTPTTKEEETKETDPIQLLNYASVVYVYASSIECELVSKDDVEIEEVEEEAPVIEEKKEKKEKDYSKLIWIALGAALLL